MRHVDGHPDFVFTLTLVIWQPRGLGIGWSASIGAGIALLMGGALG
jgi:arsenical pump membrane protein